MGCNLALEIGPWDAKKSVHTQMRPASVSVPPAPILISADREEKTPAAAVVDEEADLVERYALEHPDSDDDVAVSKEGGGSVETPSAMLEKRPLEDATERPASVKQRVAEVEKKSKQMNIEAELPPAKSARFDADSAVPEPQSKVPKLFPPSFAGDVSSSGAGASSASSSRAWKGSRCTMKMSQLWNMGTWTLCGMKLMMCRLSRRQLKFS